MNATDQKVRHSLQDLKAAWMAFRVDEVGEGEASREFFDITHRIYARGLRDGSEADSGDGFEE